MRTSCVTAKPGPARWLPLMAMAGLGLCSLSLASDAEARGKIEPWNGYPEWTRGAFEFGVHASHLSLRDMETDERLPMGGAGFRLRYRLNRRWGMESAVDLLGSGQRYDVFADEAPVKRLTAPITVSGMYYLLPDSKFQLYGLLGLGVAPQVVTYDDLGESMSWASPVFQAGVGGQFRFDGWRLDLSLRSLAMDRNGADLQFATLPEAETRPVDYQPRLGDRTVLGTMFSVGVTFGVD